MILLSGVSSLLGCHEALRRPDALLLLQVTTPQALVYVDDRPVPGQQLETGVAVFSGVHRIEVRAPGCFTAYREVAVAPSGQARISVTLRLDPDAPEPDADADRR